MKYTKKYLTEHEVAINLQTQEDWYRVMAVIKDGGVVFFCGEPDEWNHWEAYKEDTCIHLDHNGRLAYAQKSYYQELGYAILPASEFLSDVEGNKKNKNMQKPKTFTKIRDGKWECEQCGQVLDGTMTKDHRC